ncbi:MAG: radical SAM protein [Clostridiales bacterium]|nr:radical SAM protein [Clostridiales bacterium]
MQSEFCLEIMKVLKANGVSCCVDTSGCVPRENIEMVINNTEMFLYDIKFIDENLHKKYTGKSNKIILDNLLYINKIGVPTEIRIPVIPTVNCGEAEKISEFLTDLRCITAVRLLRYNNLAGSKYLRCAMKNTMPNVAPPTDDEIKKFAEPFIKRKIKIII